MKESLVIILFDHPLIHTSDYASQTCEYVRKNNVVIGVLMKDAQSLKELLQNRTGRWLWKNPASNYYLFKPLFIIPFRRYTSIIRINIMLNTLFLNVCAKVFVWKNRLTKKYVWIFNPEYYPIVSFLKASCISIYDCVDYHGKESFVTYERKLIEQCDYVFVNSHALYILHHSVRRDIHLVPMGFDLRGFSRTKTHSFSTLPNNRPIVGYVGGINSRLDYPLLLSVVNKNPHVYFVFVGPIQIHESQNDFQHITHPMITKLLAFKNTYHLAYVPKKDIPAIIRQFDIGMIPYNIKKHFNIYSYPMKLFEYFYMGKPVLATPILELKHFPFYVKASSAPHSWNQEIRALLSSPWPIAYQRHQRTLAKRNSWDEKLRAIEKFIE